jgi:hypothetical protein
MFFIAIQLVFTSAERQFGSAVPAALATAVLAAIYLLERRLGLAMPRVRRYVERHKPERPRIEYQI